MRLDRTRDGVLESKTFHGSNPSLRPDACCRHSMYRAFVLPAVVNRLPLRAPQRKERRALRFPGEHPCFGLVGPAYSKALLGPVPARDAWALHSRPRPDEWCLAVPSSRAFASRFPDSPERGFGWEKKKARYVRNITLGGALWTSHLF